MDHLILEIGLALVLIGFAVALAARLRLSNVPCLIIIGMIVGPHAPQFGVFDFRFIQTGELITFMGQLGVLFLLFYLGLEANVTRLIAARLRLSNVPFLIIIGMIVGPHAPQFGVFDFRFIQTGELITFTCHLGVLFLLFYFVF